MKNTDQTYTGTVTLRVTAPNAKPLFQFSGMDQTGEEVFYTFRPFRVPGFVTPEEFLSDVASAPRGALPGKLTLNAPDFDIGRFRYRRPGTTTDTQSGANEAEPITREKAMQPAAAATPAAAPAKTPAPPPREPEPAPSRGMDMDF